MEQLQATQHYKVSYFSHPTRKHLLCVKHLSEHSGFLDKLLPGDLVLADRDFTVEDSVGLFCAELVTPPFTRGKKQLSHKEIESARKISRVRINVERVIGMLRQKYTILGVQLCL